MVAIWSPRAKIIAERRLWLAVLRAQRELGVEVPEKAIADYERVLEQGQHVELGLLVRQARRVAQDVARHPGQVHRGQDVLERHPARPLLPHHQHRAHRQIRRQTRPVTREEVRPA